MSICKCHFYSYFLGSVSVVTKWLNDCEKLIKSYNLLDQFPILYYHLSLVYALNGMTDSSRTAFDSFLNE